VSARRCGPALLASLVLLACDRDVRHLELSPEEPSQQTVGGVHFLELFERKADTAGPVRAAR